MQSEIHPPDAQQQPCVGFLWQQCSCLCAYLRLCNVGRGVNGRLHLYTIVGINLHLALDAGRKRRWQLHKPSWTVLSRRSSLLKQHWQRSTLSMWAMMRGCKVTQLSIPYSMVSSLTLTKSWFASPAQTILVRLFCLRYQGALQCNLPEAGCCPAAGLAEHVDSELWEAMLHTNSTYEK